jgi:hypothetical protein
MQKNIKRILVAGFATACTVVAFTMSVNNSSLQSLRANAQDQIIDDSEFAGAGTKCVEATNSDCKSPSTGQIYCGYKAAAIGS